MNSDHKEKATRRKLNSIANFTDDSIRLPGGFRIGWDGIIGLVPGVGDVIGLLLSSYLIHSASQLGASKSLLIRMTINTGIDTLIGAIPFAGDIFDFVFKSNKRNMKLLERHLDAPVTTDQASKMWIATAFIIGALMLLTALFLVIRIVAWAWQLIF